MRASLAGHEFLAGAHGIVPQVSDKVSRAFSIAALHQSGGGGGRVG